MIVSWSCRSRKRTSHSESGVANVTAVTMISWWGREKASSSQVRRCLREIQHGGRTWNGARRRRDVRCIDVGAVDNDILALLETATRSCVHGVARTKLVLVAAYPGLRVTELGKRFGNCRAESASVSTNDARVSYYVCGMTQHAHVDLPLPIN